MISNAASNQPFGNVKQEDISDVDDSEATEGETGPSTTHEEAGPSRSIQLVQMNQDNVMPLDNRHAAFTSYPPGCPVLHVDATRAPPVVTMGVVTSVSFDVSSKELFYHVAPINVRTEDIIFALEDQLQFAPLCTVEADIDDGSGLTTKQAIVLTSYQPSSKSFALYSLQEDIPSGALFHGITKAYVKYRPVDAVEPNIERQNVVTHQAAAAQEIPTGNQSSLPLASNSTIQPPTELACAVPSILPPSPRVGRRPSTPGSGVKVASKRPSIEMDLGTAECAATCIDRPSFKRLKSSKGTQSSDSERPWNVGHGSGFDTHVEARESELPSRRNTRPSKEDTVQHTAIISPDALSMALSTSRVTEEEEEDEEDEDVIVTKFVIPGCTFRLDTITCNISLLSGIGSIAVRVKFTHF